jgi:hypothetical protein
MAKTTKAAGTLFGTRTGRKATVKAGKAASKAAAKSGKAQAKLAKNALRSSEPSGSRFLKYGIFALGGFAIGALLARARGNQDPSFTEGTGQHSPDAGSPAGRRGETWGSGTPTGSTSGGSQQGASPESGIAQPPLQRPEDPNRTGTERDYSDPSGGPLIGRSHDPERGDVPVQYEEIEDRIRTRIGEDPRTLGLQHLNVEVNDDVVDIRGVAPSQDAKEVVGEIAAEIPGVREVRNLMTVTS